MQHWIDQLSEAGFFNSAPKDEIEEIKSAMLASVAEGKLYLPDSTNRIFSADAEELHEDGFAEALNDFARVARQGGIEVAVEDMVTDYDATPMVRQITVNGKRYDLPFEYKGLKDWAAAEQQFEDIVEDVLRQSPTELRLFGTGIDSQAMDYVLLTRAEFEVFDQELPAQIEHKPFVLSIKQKRQADAQHLKAMLGENRFDQFKQAAADFNREHKQPFFHRALRFLGGCIFVVLAVWLLYSFVTHFNDPMMGKKAKIWHLITLSVRLGFAVVFGVWGVFLVFRSFSK